MEKMATEEHIQYAMDMIAKKKINVPVIMSDYQNHSIVDHDNADLREWLAGMTDEDCLSLIEFLVRM